MNSTGRLISYEGFVKEAEIRVKKYGKYLKGSIIFSDIESWLNIDFLIDQFNYERRLWNVEFVSTPQKDFFIFRFYHLVDKSKEYRFYVKSFPEQKHITLLVFSYANIGQIPHS